MFIQILLAFIGGVLTIAAPCILLPLPIILGGSVNQQSKTRPLFITLGFVITFSVLALGLNLLTRSLHLDPNTLRNAAVVLLAIFAFFMIWPTPFELLTQRMSGMINKAGQTATGAGAGNWGGLLIGVVIGVIWAPCAGPILGSILTLIARENNLAKASIQLIAYALGAGVPMLAIAYGGQALTTRVRSIAKYGTRLQQIFGVVLLLLAAAIYFQYDTVIQAKLVSRFPGLGSGFEESLVNNTKTSNPQPVIEDTSPQIPTPEEKSPTNPLSVGNGYGSIPQPPEPLKNYGKAPELTGITHWLNSDPLTLASLKGKVVLIDFWTYSCINCVRTLPYVTKWYDTYKDQGFVVIGVHTPEFAFEKVTSNIQTAIKQHGIHYPVAQDDDYATWNAYNNEFWPAEYVIDKDGKIVYEHFGEGHYDITEGTIRYLLGQKGPGLSDKGQNLSKVDSPEMYFGTSRLEYFASEQKPSTSATYYTLTKDQPLNTFSLEGTWQFDPDKVQLMEAGGKIHLHFKSGKVYMVAESKEAQNLSITVDGKKQAPVLVKDSSLYPLFESDSYSEHDLIIDIPQSGFDAFTFTFG